MIDDEASSKSRRYNLKELGFEYGGIENLSEVMTVMERAFPKIYGESWNNNQCRSMLSLPGTKLLLVRLGQDLCGFSICRTVIDEQELLMIAVDPTFQKTGIASSLLNEIALRAKEENVEIIFLEVRSNNPAQSLYQKHGFEKIGVRAAYYTGTDKVKYDANTYRKLLKNHK